MIKTASFAPQEPGLEYLTEGGTETEICYRHGHEIREFAMFELIENPAAMTDLCDMYRRYLDVAAKHGFAAMTGGLDYRASPDWGKKLGYSPEGLADIQHRCMGFLREITAPYADQLPKIVLCGYVGPRSDAYDPDMTISVEEAEGYHSVQIQTLKDANADFTWASSFTNVNEAVGVTRAAAKIGMPVAISFT
ncbi:MAG: homocysteine S-methyltransferase family protein, partial [Rhodobacteraceae bacterium]|nr:homocysteine S-methyltransferase family protein [Paracoccaceae bacterium]